MLNNKTINKTNKQNVAMMYRIVNGLAAIAASEHLTPESKRTGGHDTRYIQPYTRLQACKNPFKSSAIRISKRTTIRPHRKPIVQKLKT